MGSIRDTVRRLFGASKEQPMVKKVRHPVLADIAVRDMFSQEERSIRNEAYNNPRSLGSEVDSLTGELVDIGRRYGFCSLKYPDEVDAQGQHIKNPKYGRVQEIGHRLNEIGGIDLMKKVYYRVESALDPVRGRMLDSSWGGIGGWLG